MKIKLLFVLAAIICGSSISQAADNVLTPKEEKQGWVLLFNGKNLNGWTNVGKSTPPTTGWTIENGVLTVNSKTKREKRGGDIITVGEYSNFELTFDFNLTHAANSGVKYFFTKYDKGGWLGQEYQVLDDNNHPDAKMGTNGNRKTASLYDVIAVKGKKQLNSPGQWNTGRVVAKGKKVTHYLNGKKTVEYDRFSPTYIEAVKTVSKFKDAVPVFGQADKGHILLQDHEDEVSYKNIKLRVLK